MFANSTVSLLRRFFVLAAGPLLLGASLASFSGCSADAEPQEDADVDGVGTAYSGLIERICDCEGCSDSTREDYFDDYGDADRQAHNVGCDNQFSEYIACADQKLECRESVARFDCDSEERSYSNCIGISSSLVCAHSCDSHRAFCCVTGIIECC